MNSLFEAFGTILNTVFSLTTSILKAVFGIKESVDSLKDLMLATALGVPVWVITLIGGVITVGGFIVWLIKKLRRT